MSCMFWCEGRLPEVSPFVTLLYYMAKQTQQLVLMLIIGVLIGTTAVMVWRVRGVHNGEGDVSSQTTTNGAPTNTESVSVASTTTTISQATAWPLPPAIPANIRVGLQVADQTQGAAVDVSGLSLTEIHWVGIYDDRDGHPGWIMGAARLHPGDTLATVDLLRPTIAGSKYYAIILNDDGDDSFNRLTDLPPLTPDKVIMVSFVAK